MDMCNRKISYLLRFDGVCLDDLKITTSMNFLVDKTKQTEPITFYTKIPNKFTSVDSWPTSSTFKCWECDLLPLSYPKFIPKNPTFCENGEDSCDPYGHFCEWNCAVRYVENNSEFNTANRWDYLESIRLFESKFTGVLRQKILPSPPKTIMKQYCGDKGLTVEEYRTKINTLNEDYSLCTYKISQFNKHNC